jgi:iron complex transport system ATP-binding protein
LMDEPLMNLDPPHQVDWLALVRHLVAQGKTVVSVLHELPMALQSDELVVMREGRVMHHGLGTDAATHRAVEQVFDQRIEIVEVQGQWVSLARTSTVFSPARKNG